MIGGQRKDTIMHTTRLKNKVETTLYLQSIHTINEENERDKHVLQIYMLAHSRCTCIDYDNCLMFVYGDRLTHLL
jgi:hypothetical protein